MWGVVDAHDIREHTLDILKIIKPKPNYLIIGTGKYNVEFPESFYQHFRKHKILVDVMPTVNKIISYYLFIFLFFFSLKLFHSLTYAVKMIWMSVLL